ncbi:MAG: VacJ family lipoprotein [Rickettsiales bacterium]|nr:VacJ family lipoprotein [Rickettsiales bacterium]
MSNFFKPLFLIVFITLILVSKNSTASNNPSIRMVNVDTSKLSDDYDYALDNDDFESYNRAIFSFNKALDDYFLAPVARGYRSTFPEWVRNRFSDFFNNAQEPRNFVNSILQGDASGALTAFWRLNVNLTFGVLGFHDAAAGFGLYEKDKYFSQTLALYGLSAGNYIVLPLFGPSTSRDFGGFIFDNLLEPDTYVGASSNAARALASYSYNFSEIVSIRENLLDITDNLEEDSFDLYSSYKSGYLQNRKKQIEDTAE